jgi:branched-chain amino acid transport system permease protein
MLMGVNPRQTEVLSFVVAGVLATVAGIAIYTGQVIQPSLGLALTIKAFIITVLAGMGSIPGVLLGAVLIGVIEALTVTYLSSSLQEFTGMVLFLVVLLLRPQGLFGFGARRG